MSFKWTDTFLLSFTWFPWYVPGTRPNEPGLYYLCYMAKITLFFDHCYSCMSCSIYLNVETSHVEIFIFFLFSYAIAYLCYAYFTLLHLGYSCIMLFLTDWDLVLMKAWLLEHTHYTVLPAFPSNTFPPHTCN